MSFKHLQCEDNSKDILQLTLMCKLKGEKREAYFKISFSFPTGMTSRKIIFSMINWKTRHLMRGGNAERKFHQLALSKNHTLFRRKQFACPTTSLAVAT